MCPTQNISCREHVDLFDIVSRLTQTPKQPGGSGQHSAGRGLVLLGDSAGRDEGGGGVLDGGDVQGGQEGCCPENATIVWLVVVLLVAVPINIT